MHIFRWLMKRPIIMVALYLLAIIAILFSMTGGGDKDAGIADSTDAQKADSSDVDISQAPKIEPSSLTSSLVDGEASDSEENSTEDAKEETAAASEENKAEENTTTLEDAEEEVTDATKEVEKAVTDESAAAVVEGTENTNESNPEPVALASTSEENTEAKETKEEVESAEAETATAVTETQFTEMSADELLLMAREAYWNNGLEESAEIYQQLINASPEVVDYKGELGNVYWRQGFPKKAAELYAEISMPMIEDGKADKVANMVGFIGLFFPEKATEIHNKLQEAK